MAFLAVNDDNAVVKSSKLDTKNVSKFVSDKNVMSVVASVQDGKASFCVDIVNFFKNGKCSVTFVVCKLIDGKFEPVKDDTGSICSGMVEAPCVNGVCHIDGIFDVSNIELTDTLFIVYKKHIHVSKVVVVLCVCIFVVISIIVFIWVQSWYEREAKRGHYRDMTPDEIAEELSEEASWYSMEISVASYMEIPEHSTKVRARVENPESNHCDQKVRMFDAENPEDILWESGGISPGECIDEITLSHELDAGVHTVVFEFQGYEQGLVLMSDDGAFLGHNKFGGSAQAEVTLYVAPEGVPIDTNI